MSHSYISRLNPYELHKHLINEYILTNPGASKHLKRDSSKDKTDLDVIRENHRFLWDNESVDTWEKQLAKKYYDKLFKEYSICDLSHYKENKIALRWRTENEVVTGKGQFVCGNKICSTKDELRSWEVNFGYMEDGQKKNALIKIRLCPPCSKCLNLHSQKREIKRLKKNKRKSKELNKSRSKDLGEEIDNPTSSTQATKKSNAKVTTEEENIDDSESDKDDEENIEKIEKLTEDCWAKVPEIEDKSREQEFDEYLEDLLL